MGSNPLRRSCHLCRSRKIKCSAEPICGACRERGIDCIYDVESGKGRPKGRKREPANNEVGNGRNVNNSQGANQPPGSSASSNGGHPKNASFNAGSQPQNNQTTTPRFVADDLSQMFQEDFISLECNTHNIFQGIIATFGRRMRENPEDTIEASGCTVAELHQKDSLCYEGLLPYMRAEMVEMIAIRFGSLGCQLRDAGDRRFYLSGLLTDKTETMFGELYAGRSPLEAFDTHRILQLVDTWFSLHPLSPILSKTLLLTSLKSNTVDQALLAMILADACSAHGASSQVSGPPELEQNLVDFATSQLLQRPAGKWTIPTTQALVLVGWREMCMKNVRRATCWLGYAGRSVTELHIRSQLGGNLNQQRINGIELAVVEDEIMRCIYWVVFSTTFWFLMQLDAPLSIILPKSLSFDFPPMNESSSAVISLDIASDNISTLCVQSRALRELWPLSQIASTTTHICALDPGRTQTSEALHGVAWQSRHLHKLRRLLSFRSEITPVCSKICGILQEAINGVEREVDDGFLQSMVLCVYRTLIIQLLFPRGGPDSQPVPITQKLVHDLCQSVSDVLSSSKAITSSQMNLGLFPRDVSRTHTIADTLALGLDACGRALLYLHSRAFSGTEAEYIAVAERKDMITVVATQLHQVSKNSFPWDPALIRPIKKRLKEVKLSFTSFSQGSDRVNLTSSFSPAMTSAFSPKGQLPLDNHHRNNSNSFSQVPSLDLTSSRSGSIDSISLPSMFNSSDPVQMDYFTTNMMALDPTFGIPNNFNGGNGLDADMAMHNGFVSMPELAASTPSATKQVTYQQNVGTLPSRQTQSQPSLQPYIGEEMGFW